MGGKSQSTIIGYKYYLGMHVVPCMAPIDGISEIWFNDRQAWIGPPGSEEITVNAFNLFGGKEREGGVAGYIDYEHGEVARGVVPSSDGIPLYAPVDQEPNDYLRQVLYEGAYTPANANGAYAVDTYNPGLVSAFRGTVGMVFRKFYWGNNPYIKPMRLKAQNVLSSYPDNDTLYSPPQLATKGSWLPTLAPICEEYAMDNVAIYVSFDNTGSFTSPEDKQMLRDQAVLTWLETLRNAGSNVAFRIEEHRNANPQTSYQAIPFTDSDVDGAKAWVEGLAAPSGLTSWRAALQNAKAFFDAAETALLGAVAQNTDYAPALVGTPSDRVEDVGIAPGIRKIILFMSDGNPTSGTYQAGLDELAEISNYQLYGIAIDTVGDLRYIDNTPADGIPIITEQNLDGMSVALSSPFRSWADLNAAHILRDVLINPVFGGSGDPTEIGTTFATVAQTFFDEGMGLSFKVSNPSDRAAFRELVESHAGCVTYMDRTTGKWEIKAIRPDYSTGSLFTFENPTITEWIGHEKPQQFELPNHITLVYTRREDGEPASISATNNAAIQVVGRLIPDKVTLEGVTCPALATKVLQRELLARTQTWRSGQIRVAYCPSTLNLGDPFIINEPRLGIDNEVMRVTEIEESDGRDNSIVITFTQDIFQYDLADTAATATDTATTGTPTAVAQPSSTIFYEELGYFEEVLVRGQSSIDTALTSDPDLGNWQITGNAFDVFHTTGTAVRDDTNAWVNVATTTLMPIWVLAADLTKNPATGTSFTAPATGREADLQAGQIIQIGAERMRLDSVSVSAGVATFNVGRGVLDTVPAAHSAGAIILGWYQFTASDAVDYTAGDAVDVRFLPSVRGDTLDINDATTQTLYLDSRAIRPYPVAQLQVDGEYTPLDAKTGNVSVTWVHRDRLQQTSLTILDHTDATIGPESGVSYHLVRRWIEDISGVETVGHSIETVLSPPQGTSTTVDVDASDMEAYRTANSVAMEIGIKSKRTVGSTEYENWQTPFVRVFVAAALAAPFNLTGEAV